MSDKFSITPEYKQWLAEIKKIVISAQLKAATVVNSALIEFYCELGKMIVEKQEKTSWGDNIIGRLLKRPPERVPRIKRVLNYQS